MVTYSSSNPQHQSWWLAHHKHSRNISWVSNEWKKWGMVPLPTLSLPGSEKIRKHSRCYCQATWEGLLLPVCLVSLWGPCSVSGALSFLLHCSAVWSFVSALCTIKMGNSKGGIWASGNRKDKKAIDDGYHTLGLFPPSKSRHNQEVRIWEFPRLCLSFNVPKDCTGDESHINSFLAIQCVQSLNPHHFFSFYYFNC